MKKVISLLLLFSLSCFAEEAELYKYSAVKAKKQVDVSQEALRRVLYNECRADVYKSIVSASRRGNDYTHVLLHGCAGREPEILKKELESKGFRIKVEYIGVRGIHYVAAMTVSWRE